MQDIMSYVTLSAITGTIKSASITQTSHCRSFYDPSTRRNFIYGYPIFKWVALTWQWWKGARMEQPYNHKVAPSYITFNKATRANHELIMTILITKSHPANTWTIVLGTKLRQPKPKSSYGPLSWSGEIGSRYNDLIITLTICILQHLSDLSWASNSFKTAQSVRYPSWLADNVNSSDSTNNNVQLVATRT